MDDIYNIFSLPDNELNLMTISHLYTMNDFGQFGRSDLFSALDKIGIMARRVEEFSNGGYKIRKISA